MKEEKGKYSDIPESHLPPKRFMLDVGIEMYEELRKYRSLCDRALLYVMYFDPVNDKANKEKTQWLQDYKKLEEGK